MSAVVAMPSEPSVLERMYWLGFVLAAERALNVTRGPASVLAALMKASPRPLRSCTFPGILTPTVNLSSSSSKVYVCTLRTALSDVGLPEAIGTHSVAHGVWDYRIPVDAAARIRELVEAAA